MVATIFCTSAGALAKAGPKVSALLSGGDFFVGADFAIDRWIKNKEGVIMCVTQYDWVTNYSSLNSAAKYLLGEATESLVAQDCINFDPSGYTGRGEAVLMLNYLERQANRAVDLLRDQNVKSFGGGS